MNATVVSDSSTQIVVTVPAGATTGEVTVTCGSNQSNVATFTVGGGNAPSITNFTPTIGPVGTVVTINGSNFQPAAVNDSLSIGNAAAPVTSANASALSAVVPSEATTGLIWSRPTPVRPWAPTISSYPHRRRLRAPLQSRDQL